MKDDQLITGLKNAFYDTDGDGTGHRLVFWNDEERAFEKSVGELLFAELAKGGVTLLRMNETGELEIKMRLERDEPETKFLLYAPSAIPAQEDDWLLDIRLYSRSFHADQASMLMSELHLENQTIKDHLAKRMRFFDEQPQEAAHRRTESLKLLVAPHDDAAALDLKMMAVLTDAHANLDSIVIALLDRAVRTALPSVATQPIAASSEGDASANDDVKINDVEHCLKFGLQDVFWQLVQERYGFTDPAPSLEKLVGKMMLTEFNHALRGCSVSSSLQPLLLPKGAATGFVQFALSLWRDSLESHASFDKWSRRVAKKHKIVEHLASKTQEELADVLTFLDCEKKILGEMQSELAEAMSSKAGFDLHAFRVVISARKSSYWVRASIPDEHEVPRSSFLSSYQALEAAAEIVALKQTLTTASQDSFVYSSAGQMWQDYITRLYQFDKGYRRFNEAADKITEAGADFLKSFAEKVEDVYCNWYLARLSAAWMPFVENAAAPDQSPLLKTWALQDVVKQQNFYKHYVQPKLKTKRVFVIISDALRYEVAQEITQELSQRHGLPASLDAMLGVLPSYTQLGMAALLPHKELSYNAKGDVKADGKSTSGIEARRKILEKVSGVAFDTGEFLKFTRKEAEAAIKGSKVVYLYDKGIDVIADKSATEQKTFSEAAEIIKELSNLVEHLMDEKKSGAKEVLITADHGFLYQASKPTEVDKSALGEKPDAYVAKKRYVIGKDLPVLDAALRGKIKATAGVVDDTQFLVPRATQLFHFTGGARFNHGGAMLQEIVVPVITVKQTKKQKKTQKEAVPVDVQLIGAQHRIVMSNHRFQLMQMSPVGEQLLPARLKIGVYDGEELVSTEEEVIFESTSKNMDERKRFVRIKMSGDNVSKACEVRLHEKNSDTISTYPVIVDIAFQVDF